jgi:aminoglycoside 3-N-acetyltransferase
MGAVAECFRTWEGTLRSGHPHTSFCARGPLAREITHGHALESKMGEQSPLARLYDLDARVLLLGVSHANDTSLHLAEVRAAWPGKQIVNDGAPMLSSDGHRAWVQFETLADDDSDFPRIGADFERDTGAAHIGPVGYAEARLFSQRAVVDYGVTWMERHRGVDADA